MMKIEYRNLWSSARDVSWNCKLLFVSTALHLANLYIFQALGKRCQSFRRQLSPQLKPSDRQGYPRAPCHVGKVARQRRVAFPASPRTRRTSGPVVDQGCAMSVKGVLP